MRVMYQYTIFQRLHRAGWVAMVSYPTLKEATTEVDRKVEELEIPYEDQPYKIVKEVVDARI